MASRPGMLKQKIAQFSMCWEYKVALDQETVKRTDEEVGIQWCPILQSLHLAARAKQPEAQMKSNTQYNLFRVPLLFWIAPVSIFNVTILSLFLKKTIISF